MAWIDLLWPGLALLALVLFGLARRGLVWCGVVWCGVGGVVWSGVVVVCGVVCGTHGVLKADNVPGHALSYETVT